MKTGEDSTYALLTAAEEREKGSDFFETGVYAALVLSTLLAIWQFAVIAKPLPRTGLSAHHHGHKAHFALDARPS